MVSRLCSECGSKLKENVRYCHDCGRKIQFKLGIKNINRLIFLAGITLIIIIVGIISPIIVGSMDLSEIYGFDIVWYFLYYFGFSSPVGIVSGGLLLWLGSKKRQLKLSKETSDQLSYYLLLEGISFIVIFLASGIYTLLRLARVL